MKYSVCAPAVFGGNVKTPGISGDKVDPCLAVIRKAGYSAYEFWSWWNQDVEKILAEQEANGLYPAALCTRSCVIWESLSDISSGKSCDAARAYSLTVDGESVLRLISIYLA